jgi:hypothetical protein
MGIALCQEPSFCRQPTQARSRVAAPVAKLGITIETNPGWETIGQSLSVFE